MEKPYKPMKEQRRGGSEENVIGRRSLLQLVASIVLFLFVFIGRGAFPGLMSTLSAGVAADSDFRSAFQKIENDIAAAESIWNVLWERGDAELRGSGESEQPTELDSAKSTQIEKEIVLLSETEGHGISYLRDYGMRSYANRKTDTEEEELLAVEIVTAVAQSHNAEGVALPANVSYEYYEFGLENTVCPVIGEVTSGFDYRKSPITGKREFHPALDIAADTGAEILAFADGIVRYIGESDDFGLYFMIDHDNGVSTFYAHCSRLMIRKGDAVSCGQVVALVGETGKTTGPHLHFTIEKDNIRLDPAYYVDPRKA